MFFKSNLMGNCPSCPPPVTCPACPSCPSCPTPIGLSHTYKDGTSATMTCPSGKLTIDEATFGGTTTSQIVNVTTKVKSLITSDKSIDYTVSNSTLGLTTDPAPGVAKK